VSSRYLILKLSRLSHPSRCQTCKVARGSSPRKIVVVDELDIIAHPKDAYFKEVFSNLQRATLFFQSHLDAPIAALIDWSSLRLEPASFVKQTLQQTHSDLNGTELSSIWDQFRRRFSSKNRLNSVPFHSDLLFTARLGEREIKLYLLFEHQTTVDKEMPLRLLSYVLEILLAH